MISPPCGVSVDRINHLMILYQALTDKHPTIRQSFKSGLNLKQNGILTGFILQFKVKLDLISLH